MTFEESVIRELDQIVKRFEKAIEKLEERDESRDGEVSDLKLQVGLLRNECRRNLKRDAGLVVTPTVLVSVIVAVVQALVSPAQAPAQPAKAPSHVAP